MHAHDLWLVVVLIGVADLHAAWQNTRPDWKPMNTGWDALRPTWYREPSL